MPTALAGGVDPRHFDRDFAVTNRLRTTAPTTCWPPAARSACGAFVAQSYAGWPFARVGGPSRREDDPLDPDPPAPLRDVARRHPPPRGGGHRRRVDRGDRPPLRRLLRPGHEPRPDGPASTPSSSAGAASRSSATAAACGPSCTSRTRRRPPWPPWSAGAAASTTSSTTSPRRSRTGCPVAAGRRRPAAAPRAALARAPRGAAGRSGHDDRGARCVERQGATGAGVDRRATRAGGRPSRGARG